MKITTTTRAAFAGISPALPLSAVLQLIEAQQLTGTLRLGFEGLDRTHGVAFGFHHGRIAGVVDRRVWNPDPADRAVGVLQRAAGSQVAFAFYPDADLAIDEDEPPLNVTAILLEAARRQDEVTR